MILICGGLANSAWAKPPLAVLLVCTDDVPCEVFAARLRGQTSDLHIEFQGAETSTVELPADLDASVTAVDGLAAARGSAVALWWRRGSLIALLREPPPGRLLVRSVVRSVPPSDWQPGSAELEAGSLIARTAIVAAIAGTPIGVPRQPPPAPPPPPPAAPAAPAMTTNAWQLSAALGWHLDWDDVPSDPGHGLAARLAAKWRRLRFGVLWTEGRTTDLTLPDTRGTLSSRQAGVLAEFDLLVKPRFTFGLEAHGGWLKHTITPLSGPYREVLKITREFAGLGVRGRYALGRGVWIWAAAGFDRVFDPITVGTRNAAGFRPVWPMAATQPSLGLGLELLFPARD